MSAHIAQEYVSIGGNRHSAASSWSTKSGVLAFGADRNVAIWKPLNQGSIGIKQLLRGHNDKVTAVTFLTSAYESAREYILSGSADGKLFVWTEDESKSTWRYCNEAAAHTGALNCIAALAGSDFLVTGGADAKCKIWRVGDQNITEVLSIAPKPRLIPLTLALGSFPKVSPQNDMFLAVAGTINEIQVYTLTDLSQRPVAEHQATLTGHEGWIRSLSLKRLGDEELLLASASHDKYVRLWKFEHGDLRPAKPLTDPSQVTSVEQTLAAKVQHVLVGNSRYAIKFEALLLGHEDWIYSAAWNPADTSEQLLTASADGSLTIWESDPSSGIWISASKLGELSDQKGATTATGSSGGFWTGLWSPDGHSVTCLSRTGSWRIWCFDPSQHFWIHRHGISGHTAAVNGLTWSSRGDYLLSTSSDQTTRLHAEWRRASHRTWHELARPQIHGYDLNCIASTGDHQFASGADEKLLRVFNEPKDIAKMMKNLSNIKEPEGVDLSETAAIPVLGLSNKAIEDDENVASKAVIASNSDHVAHQNNSVVVISEPPTEDLLSRHTLWPEHEKLYGHGYEISECAFGQQNRLLATACKASSADHAVIRIYDTSTWHEIKPPLTAHSLTVTKLEWSCHPDNYLLSVGRDRQWTVFKQDQQQKSWKILQSNPKAHTRMILDAAWSPVEVFTFFATAGRDKTVKVWLSEQRSGSDDKIEFKESGTIRRESAVTAVDFTNNHAESHAVLAVGEESGALSVHTFEIRNMTLISSVEIGQDLLPSKPVTKVVWREDSMRHEAAIGCQHLAVAAADGSVRIFAINVEQLSCPF